MEQKEFKILLTLTLPSDVSDSEIKDWIKNNFNWDSGINPASKLYDHFTKFDVEDDSISIIHD